MKPSMYFKGLTWLILLNLMVKPVWIFFIDRQVQNRVGLEDYGKYFSVLNLSLVLLSISDAGLSTMLNQRLAHRTPVNSIQLLQVKFFLLVLYSMSVCFIAWLAHLNSWQLIFYVLFIQVLISVFVFLRSIITAHQYFTADAWLSVIDKMLMILLCGPLLYTSFFIPISLIIFLKIQAICTFLAVFLAGIYILSKRLMVQGEKEKINSIFYHTWPFALIIFLMSVHYRLDGFLLERFHPDGARQAGMYAAGYRLLDAGNMVGYLAASFLVPFLARHQANQDLVTQAVLKTRHVLFSFAIGLVSFSFVFAPWVQQLLYHSADPYFSRVIQLCVAALPAYYLVHIYGSMLTASANLKVFIKILVLTVVLNVILNWLLLPTYGALGCGMAALVSQYFCGISVCLSATKKMKITLDHRSILVYLLSAGFLWALLFWGRMILANVWMLLAIAIIICIVLLGSLLGFVNKNFILLR